MATAAMQLSLLSGIAAPTAAAAITVLSVADTGPVEVTDIPAPDAGTSDRIAVQSPVLMFEPLLRPCTLK